jgi:hypothetical protein
MKKLTLQAMIPTDGKLRLEVPTDLPAGPVEVDLTIRGAGEKTSLLHSSETASLVAESVPTDKSRRDAEQPHWKPAPPTKTCSGLFLGRLPHEYDIDAVLDEVNTRWKASLLDLDR